MQVQNGGIDNLLHSLRPYPPSPPLQVKQSLAFTPQAAKARILQGVFLHSLSAATLDPAYRAEPELRPSCADIL